MLVIELQNGDLKWIVPVAFLNLDSIVTILGISHEAFSKITLGRRYYIVDQALLEKTFQHTLDEPFLAMDEADAFRTMEELHDKRSYSMSERH
jgi:hypothetical protein